jgi:hypothetical protein
MRPIRFLNFLSAVLMMIAIYVFATHPRIDAQQSAPVKITTHDIGGVVSSSKGPEAGVWVIAETTDLPTRYIKEVVTDDRGRYLIPDLPKAKYTVWARGYGLVDSPKVQTEPGKLVDLKPTIAPDAKTAAQAYIPPTIGTRCSRFPRRTNFPARGPSGQRHFTEHQEPGPVDSPDQDRQLRVVPPARQQIYAHHSSSCSQPSIRPRRPGCAACSPDRPATPCWAA